MKQTLRNMRMLAISKNALYIPQLFVGHKKRHTFSPNDTHPESVDLMSLSVALESRQMLISSDAVASVICLWCQATSVNYYIIHHNTYIF